MHCDMICRTAVNDMICPDDCQTCLQTELICKFLEWYARHTIVIHYLVWKLLDKFCVMLLRVQTLLHIEV